MARGFFITGTDTDVGKTTIALGLMVALKNTGLTVAAMKPVSAGCAQTEQGLRNDDAVSLMQQASLELPYELVNPYTFELAIAPHIAAAEQNIEMTIATIEQAYREIANQVDVVIVEGAGGWLVPLNATETLADVARVLQLEVIHVVGLRLGCLNHALLTSESIASHKLTQIGWVANHLAENMDNADENIRTLKSRINANYLGEIPYDKNPSGENIAQHLRIEPFQP